MHKPIRGIILLVIILVGGLSCFLWDYAIHGKHWALHSANGRLYQGPNQRPSMGVVIDRRGEVLLQLSSEGSYAKDDGVRKGMLHWLGDRQGNIYPGILHHYFSQMAGYSLRDGLYSYDSCGGVMQLTLSSAACKTALEALGEYSGTIAVMNYHTGELLCAVSTPTFDAAQGNPAEPVNGVYWNRFTQGVYVPGSIFKLVTTAAALEELPHITRQQFTCYGEIILGNERITCEMAHGTMDLKEAMMHSCNCAYAAISYQLGRERLLCYANGAEVLKPVCFDGITTAAGGLGPDLLGWSGIGQGMDQINPCAFLAFVAAIARDGQGVEPYVVSSVERSGKCVYRACTKERERIMSCKTARKLTGYMRYNVDAKYGKEQFTPFCVCAKSGTAEVEGHRPNAMFVGFVQEEQYPLAFIVAVEDGGYGAKVCIPMIQRVLLACKNEMDL